MGTAELVENLGDTGISSSSHSTYKMVNAGRHGEYM